MTKQRGRCSKGRGEGLTKNRENRDHDVFSCDVKGHERRDAVPAP